MRYGARIRESIQALPPLQAERRLRNRLDPQSTRLLDDLLADGDSETLQSLRERLSDYDRMLLDRLLESPTAHPPKKDGAP